MAAFGTQGGTAGPDKATAATRHGFQIGRGPPIPDGTPTHDIIGLK